jgi:hypothetical protein
VLPGVTEKLGQNLVGLIEQDWMGQSVALNGDGNGVAIGAPGHDGVGEDSGLVKVFSVQGDRW